MAEKPRVTRANYIPCPKCGELNHPNFTWCEKCGKLLAAAPSGGERSMPAEREARVRKKVGWKFWAFWALASAVFAAVGMAVGWIGGAAVGLLALMVMWNPAMAEFGGAPPDFTIFRVVGMAVGGPLREPGWSG